MKILAVCTGKAEKIATKSGRTGLYKRPQTRPIMINNLGLDGDTICDTQNHGGVDQAVYIFGEPDRVWWQTYLKRDVPPGFFGENLLIDGLETASLVIGDIIQTDHVILQITSPRIPCATYAAHIGRHIGSGQAIKDFYTAARPGAYARVLQPGTMQAGDTATLTPYVGERIKITENMREFLAGFSDSFLRRAATVPAHYKLHDLIRSRLA